MPRPAPDLLLSHHSDKTDLVEEVVTAPGLWAVLLNGQPINIRTSKPNSGFKYTRISHSHPAHAHAAARRLNALFETNAFEVWEFPIDQMPRRVEIRDGPAKAREDKLSRMHRP